MKKAILMLLLLPGCIVHAYGQAPLQFNYQAVARDASDQPYRNTNLGVRISLLINSSSGEVEYSERHDVATTDLGVFNLKIGKGEPISGDFAAVEWGRNTYYLEVAIDPAGGDDYITMGSSQLLSVPYALYANQAGGGDSDNDPANEIQTLSLSGTVLTLKNGNAVDLAAVQDGVNDADADPVNELQELTLTGDSLRLSQGGGAVRLPAGTSYAAGTGISIAGNTITNTGDNDNSAVNELQSLSISGNALSISGGNSVSLPVATPYWTKVGENIFYDSGSVNIGKNLTTEGIFRLFPDGSVVPLAVIQQGNEGAGELITRGANGSINTRLANDAANANTGAISVHDQQGNLKVGLQVNSSGEGTVATDLLDAGYATFNASAGASPITARVGGDVKFQVHTNGGVSVGTPIPPTTNGLAVGGIVTAHTLNANSVNLSNSPTPAEDPLVIKMGQETKLKLGADGNLTVGGAMAVEEEVTVKDDVIMENDVAIWGDLVVDQKITATSITTAGGLIHLGDIKILNNTQRYMLVDAHIAPIAENGNLVYDLGTPAGRWRNIYAENGTIQTSDLREKKNIQDLNYGLKEVMQLRPVQYEWKDKPYSDPRLGLIAQELLPVIPEVVKTHEWQYGEDGNATPQKTALDRLGVYYADLIPVLIKAIQEQQALIEIQQTRLDHQQEEINNLKVSAE